jgi:hypothetical protein
MLEAALFPRKLASTFLFFDFGIPFYDFMLDLDPSPVPEPEIRNAFQFRFNNTRGNDNSRNTARGSDEHKPGWGVPHLIDKRGDLEEAVSLLERGAPIHLLRRHLQLLLSSLQHRQRIHLHLQ